MYKHMHRQLCIHADMHMCTNVNAAVCMCKTCAILMGQVIYLIYLQLLREYQWSLKLVKLDVYCTEAEVSTHLLRHVLE